MRHTSSTSFCSSAGAPAAAGGSPASSRSSAAACFISPSVSTAAASLVCNKRQIVTTLQYYLYPRMHCTSPVSTAEIVSPAYNDLVMSLAGEQV